MKPDASYRTPLPPDDAEWERSSSFAATHHPVPSAHDNDAEDRVLVYGPKGEALIRQEPRRAGFRPPR